MDQIAQTLFDELESLLRPGHKVTERGRNEEGPYVCIGDLLQVGVEETDFPTSFSKGDYRHMYDVVIRLGDEEWGRTWHETVRSLTRGEWVRKAIPALLELLQDAYRDFGREEWRGSMTPQAEPLIDAHDERFKREYKWPVFRPSDRP